MNYTLCLPHLSGVPLLLLHSCASAGSLAVMSVAECLVLCPYTEKLHTLCWVEPRLVMAILTLHAVGKHKLQVRSARLAAEELQTRQFPPSTAQPAALPGPTVYSMLGC
jgi:hypothetical protein